MGVTSTRKCERSHFDLIHRYRAQTRESPVANPAVQTSQDDRFVIGVDYGTLSGRALVVRVSDGAEIATATLDYPHSVMDTVLAASGKALPPDWALQVPADYIDVLKVD